MVIVNCVLVGYVDDVAVNNDEKSYKEAINNEDGACMVRNIVIVNYVFVHYVDGDELKRINKIL